MRSEVVVMLKSKSDYLALLNKAGAEDEERAKRLKELKAQQVKEEARRLYEERQAKKKIEAEKQRRIEAEREAIEAEKRDAEALARSKAEARKVQFERHRAGEKDPAVSNGLHRMSAKASDSPRGAGGTSSKAPGKKAAPVLQRMSRPLSGAVSSSPAKSSGGGSNSTKRKLDVPLVRMSGQGGAASSKPTSSPSSATRATSTQTTPLQKPLPRLTTQDKSTQARVSTAAVPPRSSHKISNSSIRDRPPADTRGKTLQRPLPQAQKVKKQPIGRYDRDSSTRRKAPVDDDDDTDDDNDDNEDDYEEDDEEEEVEEPDRAEVSAAIQELFGRGKSKAYYLARDIDSDEDGSDMEADADAIRREEARAARLARQEDELEEQRLKEHEQRKASKKRRVQ